MSRELIPEGKGIDKLAEFLEFEQTRLFKIKLDTQQNHLK